MLRIMSTSIQSRKESRLTSTRAAAGAEQKIVQQTLVSFTTCLGVSFLFHGIGDYLLATVRFIVTSWECPHHLTPPSLPAGMQPLL
jgi:hypothetical protein